MLKKLFIAAAVLVPAAFAGASDVRTLRVATSPLASSIPRESRSAAEAPYALTGPNTEAQRRYLQREGQSMWVPGTPFYRPWGR